MEASVAPTAAAPGEHSKATIPVKGENVQGIPPNQPHDPGGTNGTFYRQKRRAEGASAGAEAGGKVSGSSAGVTVATSSSENRGMLAPKGTVGGREAGAHIGAVAVLGPPADASVLGDPQKAFGYFRDRHAGRTALEDNKTLLGQKYARAKVRDDVFGYWGNGAMAGRDHYQQSGCGSVMVKEGTSTLLCSGLLLHFNNTTRRSTVRLPHTKRLEREVAPRPR